MAPIPLNPKIRLAFNIMEPFSGSVRIISRIISSFYLFFFFCFSLRIFGHKESENPDEITTINDDQESMAAALRSEGPANLAEKLKVSIITDLFLLGDINHEHNNSTHPMLLHILSLNTVAPRALLPYFLNFSWLFRVDGLDETLDLGTNIP